ncbi:MAG: hypothetical protein H0W00_02575 [Chloroflexi bacterium]|nr:hypothetical protein [Chloroflexota bacterium]
MTGVDAVEGLDEARFLQFAGEGAAEALARQIIIRANENGADLQPPPVSADGIGNDRLRQDLYQMVHVSQGLCRILLRL